MKRAIGIVFFAIFILAVKGILSCPLARAQNPPPQQQAGGQERARELQEQQEKLRKEIGKEKPKTTIEENLPEGKAAGPAAGEKALIKKITVTGATLVSETDIRKIVSPYENKELYLADMEEIAGRISDLYRQRGYVTSRAYLPPQKIENASLDIKVIEGIMGDVKVQGNKYFKTDLYMKYMTLNKGEPFNYKELQKDMRLINQKEDRSVKAVITPGKEPGSTDVLLKAEDRLPIHAGFTYDDYASRYLRKNRYLATVSDNNLLGRDDSLVLQYQLGDAADYRYIGARYLYPLTTSTNVGFYAADSTFALGKQYRTVMSRGKSRMYSAYVNQDLINEEDISVTWNTGFDYQDTFNFLLGQESSRDRLRVAKTSLDIDTTDNFGRSLLIPEFSYGIPGIMGGSKAVDSRSSRDGSGGKFTKTTVNLLRLQQMPNSSTLFWKTQLQFSPYILDSEEQFQLGGINNVRAYPAAEFVGDNGYSTTFEYSIPPYGVSRDFKFPFSNARFYDAFRAVCFYDWANVHLDRPQTGERKNTTRSGYGIGFRINLPENFSLRSDFAWPLDKTPSDGKHLHSYLEIKKEF